MSGSSRILEVEVELASEPAQEVGLALQDVERHARVDAEREAAVIAVRGGPEEGALNAAHHGFGCEDAAGALAVGAGLGERVVETGSDPLPGHLR